jgi:hypothetical protein
VTVEHDGALALFVLELANRAEPLATPGEKGRPPEAALSSGECLCSRQGMTPEAVTTSSWLIVVGTNSRP